VTAAVMGMGMGNWVEMRGQGHGTECYWVLN
jgi:hypothetical protein